MTSSSQTSHPPLTPRASSVDLMDAPLLTCKRNLVLVIYLDWFPSPVSYFLKRHVLKLLWTNYRLIKKLNTLTYHFEFEFCKSKQWSLSDPILRRSPSIPELSGLSRNLTEQNCSHTFGFYPCFENDQYFKRIVDQISKTVEDQACGKPASGVGCGWFQVVRWCVFLFRGFDFTISRHKELEWKSIPPVILQTFIIPPGITRNLSWFDIFL